MLGRWLGGVLKLADEDEARGRVLMIDEILDISHRSLCDFYGVALKADEGDRE